LLFAVKASRKKERIGPRPQLGIYAVVRHPLYLGWLLAYVALILLSQHWLTAIIGIPGMVCVYLISRQEDNRLVEKFGDDYKHYMQKVPRMNLLDGVIRLIRRRKGERK
jgi:steroid 5-alpha reductase family enzyme